MSEEEIIEYFKNKEKELQDEINRVEDYVNTLYEEEELEAIQGLLDLYNKEKKKNKELEKYDYRKIKLDEKDKISSIHFTKEQLDLMNLGIALYVGIPKILADKEDEETDI